LLKRIKNIAYAVRSAITSTFSRPQRWIVEMFGGAEAKSGARVDENTAVQVTAVFACVRLLAQTIASLPLHTYRRLNDGKERAYDHPAYHVLHSLANPECTSYNLRQIMMVNLLLTGDAYAEIVRNGAGALIELWPIPSNRVTPRRNRHTSEVFYEVHAMDGQTRILYPEQVLHIPWVGMEAFRSFRPVELAREAIGLSMAAEEFGSRFFSDGANASGIAEYPGRMSDEAYNRFKKTFNEKYVGLNKNQRVMFLEQGLKFTKLTINPNEAQAIETRKFQVIEVARFYNVPPHLIMDLERATFSNVEHQDISFVKYSIRPYLVCWEQEMLRTIFIPSERHKYFSEFSVDGLLRGDYKTRQEGLEIMRRNGVINADQWAAMENMNPLPDGQGKPYFVPMNWMTIEQSQKAEPEPGGERMEGRQAALERSANAKYKTAQNYKRLFEDAALRIVRREKNQILDKGRATLARDKFQEFDAWLENYYRDASTWMIPILSPVLMAYAEAIEPLAADEVGARALPPELEKWVLGYLANWSRDYTKESLAQIRAVVKKALDDGEDPYEAVETRLLEWEEKRPEKTSLKETVEAAGVISKYVYKSAGIRKIRWVNAGGNPCPYCQELDGKIVGIEQAFLGKDDRLDSEDGSMQLKKPTVTPPLHEGCVCMIVPDR